MVKSPLLSRHQPRTTNGHSLILHNLRSSPNRSTASTLNFQGYTHRATNGHVNSVSNGQAKSYVFSKKRKQDNTTSRENALFCPSLPFKLSVKFSTVEDQDVELYVLELLALSTTSNSQCNVLDIRRSFPEGIRPDTRQLNRVLYQMESSKHLKKGPPYGSNRKPTWQYISK